MDFLKTKTIALFLLLLSGCATTEYNLASRTKDVMFISTEREVRMGRNIAEAVERKFKLAENQEIQSRIQSIGERIANVSNRQDVTYHFRVLDDEEVNAFALPGGYVYIFIGLLERLKTDDEIAAVLAHEVGHIAARHSVKRLQGALGLTALRILAAIGARDIDVHGNMDYALAQIMAGYSQEDEILADRLGVRYMKLAGYNPEAALTVLKMMREKIWGSPIRPYRTIRSHPGFDERIAAVEREIYGFHSFQSEINIR
jgi:predicted Zn-dependent protease